MFYVSCFGSVIQGFASERPRTSQLLFTDNGIFTQDGKKVRTIVLNTSTRAPQNVVTEQKKAKPAHAVLQNKEHAQERAVNAQRIARNTQKQAANAEQQAASQALEYSNQVLRLEAEAIEWYRSRALRFQEEAAELREANEGLRTSLLKSEEYVGSLEACVKSAKTIVYRKLCSSKRNPQQKQNAMKELKHVLSPGFVPKHEQAVMNMEQALTKKVQKFPLRTARPPRTVRN